MRRICLFIDIPIAGYRPNWSRFYQDTYPVPPHSTLYGLLLSLLGVEREEKDRYLGIRLAIVIQEHAKISKIFRKFRRIAQSRDKEKVDLLADRRPDYQELVLWQKLWLWIENGECKENFTEAICRALSPNTRGQIQRSGALSLGESSHMINEISLLEKPIGEGFFVMEDNTGMLTMPIYVDHKDQKNPRTAVKVFKVADKKRNVNDIPPSAFINIAY